MQTEIQVLLTAAVVVAFLHTVTGPDHYVPFVALSKARGWSFTQTLGWTVLCGCGHVWSSVLLGLGGAGLGWSLSKISLFENIRGGIAGWSLLIFGLIYCFWGLFRAYRNRAHKHFDTYEDGSLYVYEHKHGQSVNIKERHRVTPWVMFIIFLLGPCEPMIPLMFFPAARSSWWSMMAVITAYTAFTLLTMIIMVTLGYYGIAFFQAGKSERYIHALGGLTLFVCGAGMVFLAW